MHKERLLKLADHLEYGKIGHAKFDFSVLNSDETRLPMRGKCGTLGCAIGECPIAFPEDWGFFETGIRIFNNPAADEWRSVTEFFQITQYAAQHLFMPFDQDVEKYGGEHLGDNATKEKVAANIRVFVKKMEDSVPKI